MATSGRAGLFTIDDGRFFGDLRGTPYTANKRQKSGALRMEFGKFTITAGSQFASTRVTVNTGIVTFVQPAVAPAVCYSGGTSGTHGIITSGSFLSGYFTTQIVQTGQYSGLYDGKDVNYFCIGY